MILFMKRLLNKVKKGKAAEIISQAETKASSL